jgi:5-methylcytosine-specific restriction endonuclease McrA
MGESQQKPESRAPAECSTCGAIFEKRRDHLKEKNYCSPGCSAKGRQRDGARWKDKWQVKQYMADYQRRNSKRISEIARQWVERNKDKRKDIQRRYREKNADKIAVATAKRRAGYKEGSLTGQQWGEIKAFYGHRCLKCQRREPEIALCIDHIAPVSKGGGHHASNIQPLCKSCNSSKCAKLIDYRGPFGIWPGCFPVAV